jgi:8-oxo-dGTP pyrophosphatase MutT (NUDIX family)
VPSLEDIESRLAAYRPRLVDEVDGRQRAAVALILRRSERGAELLFIERALREGDPWSGHMAFPGGRLDPGDPSERDAAERETLEEVGLSLARSNYLGRLDDLEGRPALPAGGLVVSAHVYHTPDPDPLRPNHEVRQAFWFPLADLQSSRRHVVYPHARYEGRELPGILVGVPDRHIVWGLTYRFLDVFLGAVGKPLPNRWADMHEEPAQEPPRS